MSNGKIPQLVYIEPLEHPGIPAFPDLREETPPAGVDANQLYMSGQWKRRSGDGIQPTATPAQLGPFGRYEPFVRRDLGPLIGRIHADDSGGSVPAPKRSRD